MLRLTSMPFPLFVFRFGILLLQALAQCQTFLSTYLPSAKRIPVASTAHAAVSLLSPSLDSAFPAIPNDTANPKGRGAAICSRVVVGIYDGLECAREGIEDKKGQF